MEHQRVIEILKTLYKKSTKVVGGRLKGGYIDHKTQENKAINTAIEALEKQIPKKPNNFDGYYCSSCKGKLARQTDLINQKYCHECGQKLDWRND